jgi:DNA-binding transcriptional LysR family regulator
MLDPLTADRRPSLAQLRALVAIAQYGSFSAAALEIDTSQSALSHAIRELEETLGARVLERGRLGAKLTPLGTRVLAHARDAMTSLEALEQEAMLERGGLRGTVRITSLRSLGTHFLPSAIREFRSRYPEVKLQFVDEPRPHHLIDLAVRDGEVDVGLMELPCNADLLEFELGRDEYALLTSSALPAPSIESWADFSAHTIIVDDECNRRVFQHHYPTALGNGLRITEDSVILGMVAGGLGISVMPMLAASPIPNGVRVQPLPEPLERRLGLAVTRRRMTVPAVRAFVENLRDYATRHPLELRVPR